MTPSLAIRLGLDLLALAVVAGGLYPHREASRSVPFALVMLNVITFGLAFLMHAVPLDLGFGLGMFAMFGILRYRTEALGIREITYVFVSIGLAMVHGIAHESISMVDLAVLDVFIVTIAAGMEWLDLGGGGPERLVLRYDRIDLLSSSRRADLLEDLRTRLHVEPLSVEIGRIDLLRDSVDLTVLTSPAT